MKNNRGRIIAKIAVFDGKNISLDSFETHEIAEEKCRVKLHRIALHQFLCIKHSETRIQ